MKKFISIITLSSLFFIVGCSSQTGGTDPQTASQAEKNYGIIQEMSVVPKQIDGEAMFTRAMYENVINDADTVQLYVSRDINFKRKSETSPTLSIESGELIESSGESITDFLIKADTQVIAGKQSSIPDLLSINTGDKLIKFANFILQENGKTVTYPNTAGGIYLPEACKSEGKTQLINGVEYILTTPCDSFLTVTARHVYNENREIIEAKGKKYKIYNDETTGQVEVIQPSTSAR